ncbi:hypothetical protein A5893_06855 [Pedobacter psychrophilus]|uniref:Transposase IS200-like domain-containing protein n=1 Tax=Pedobacter psychrophilus TaxID=1826909 RepID=A0A179DID8_9SPHI|nr:transposase [Pedobacter psychrophilus]OAQ40654.1 hypothetical protein A5893_06855 [Pedobacter psychrophilus]
MKYFNDCYYHIYNRGNNKENVFFEEENYIYFLNQFKKYVTPSLDVLAYCLMPNHFHFFVKITNEQSFDKNIKNFFISYSKSINKKYNRVGSLFQGRFKSKEIEKESYYTRIITYIHQNPIEAFGIDNLQDYRFSSYTAYLSNNITLFKKEEMLKWFGGIEGFKNSHKIIEDKTYEVFKTS